MLGLEGAVAGYQAKQLEHQNHQFKEVDEVRNTPSFPMRQPSQMLLHRLGTFLNETSMSYVLHTSKDLENYNRIICTQQ